MTPKFVADTSIDVKCQKEASLGAIPRAFRWVTLLCCGITVILLGVTVWQYIVNRSTTNLLMMLLLIAAAAYLAYSQFFGPKKALRDWEEGVIKAYGVSALKVHIEFYELTFVQTMEQRDEELEGAYSEVTQMRETEHLFLLRSSSRRWYFVAKDGFTVGTADEFREFIRSRIG